MSRAAPSELIRLAIRSGKASCQNYDEFEAGLQRATNASLDYVRRQLAGTRTLGDRHLDIITELLGLKIDFDMSERQLASALGLSRKEAARAIGDMASGLDLTARTADRLQVQRLRDLIGGYWESIYWSVSNTREQAVSRDLCVIGDIDDDNYIECKILDGHFEYSGVVFPVVQHLYFILEKDRIFNEVIFYITNLPDRTPPVLRGIIGCLSGGVNDSRSYPSASKVAFRYLGSTAAEVRKFYPTAPDGKAELAHFLRNTVPTYITRDQMDRGEVGADALIEIAAIDNTVSRDAVPFAIRSAD